MFFILPDSSYTLLLWRVKFYPVKSLLDLRWLIRDANGNRLFQLFIVVLY